jgi:hypothetical protein
LDELFPAQIRGPAPKDQLIVLDGKQPKHGSGASVLSAVTVPSQHYLGSAVVDQKTNEIPVARELFKRLELEDWIRLAALWDSGNQVTCTLLRSYAYPWISRW